MTIRFPPERSALVESPFCRLSDFPGCPRNLSNLPSSCCFNPRECSADASSATLTFECGERICRLDSSTVRSPDRPVARFKRHSISPCLRNCATRFRNFKKNFLRFAANLPPEPFQESVPESTLRRSELEWLTQNSLTTTAYVAVLTSDSFDVTHHSHFCQRLIRIILLFLHLLLWNLRKSRKTCFSWELTAIG